MANSDDLLNQWEEERKFSAAPITPVSPNVKIPTISASDKLLENLQAQRDQQFTMSVNLGVKSDPDRAAKIQSLAQQLGVSTQVVESHEADLDQFVRARSIEIKNAASNDPVLRQQFMKPEFAKIAHDDWDNLSLTEKTMRWLKEIPDDISKGFQAGVIQSDIGFLGQEAQTGRNDKAMWDQIKKLKEKDKALKGSGGLLEASSKIVGQMSSSIPSSIEFGLATGVTYGGATLIAGQLGPQAAVPEEIFTVPTAAISGFWAGFSAKMAEQTYRQEAGASYLDQIEAGVDKDVAQYTSAGVGLVNAALESVGMKFVAAPFKKLMINAVTKDVAASMTKPTVRAAVTSFGTNYAKAYSAEVGTEILQEFSAIAGEEMGRALSDKNIPSLMDSEEGRQQISDRIVGVFEEVAKGMALLALPGASINFRYDYKAAKQAEKQSKFFMDLTEQATESKLRVRSPDAYHEIVGAQASEGGVPNIYVDGEAFAQSMRESGVTVEDIRRTMPEVAAQIESGIIKDTDVVIPTADYATHIAGTDFGKAVVQHARADIDGISASELIEFQKNKRDFFAQAANEILDKQNTTDEFKKSAGEVETIMFNQLKDTGRYSNSSARLQAQFVKNFAITNAPKLGMTPLDFYNKYMYKVESTGGMDIAAGMSLFNQGMGINVRNDLKSGTRYADEIVSGNKVYETRDTDSLRAYVGKRIAIVRTGEGEAKAIGEVDIGEPIVVNEQQFNEMRDQHLVPAGSTFDIKPGGVKYLYPVSNPVKYDQEMDVGKGIVARKILAKEGFFQQDLEQQTNTPADNVNNEADATGDDEFIVITQKDIPTAVDDAAVLDNALKISGGKVWNKGRDLKMAIQEAVQQMAAAAGVDVSAPSAQTDEYLKRVGLRDVMFALAQNPNAIGWYDEKTNQALAVMATIHPEIAKNENAKFAFVWALAVTSNGLKVDKNFELAEKAYEYYKKNKVMPTDIEAGQAQGAINKSLGLFNQLVNDWGIDNLRKFMQTNFTVGEIASISQDLKPGGEHADTQVKGAAIIGPKIGNGFFSNLYGDFSSLTMDRWLIRTWGRWTGTLIKAQPKHTALATARLNAAVEAMTAEEKKLMSDLVKVDVAIADPAKLSAAVQKASMDKEARAAMNETAAGEEFRKAGNGLAKYLDGQKEAPAGPHERTYIRSIFNSILEEVKKDPAYADLTMADMQAVLWYAEKRLYETAKEDVNVDEESTEGYSDEDAPDYANAAAAVAREKGISEKKINAALKQESKDERSKRSRLSTEQAQGQAQNQQAVAGGFTERKKQLFRGAVATLIARSNRTGAQKSSWSYRRASDKDSGGERLLKARKKKDLKISYVSSWKAGRSLGNIYRNNGIPVPEFFELEQTPANAARFVQAISESKAAKPETGSAVYVYPVEQYQGMRLFLSEDGKAGVAIKEDGDIVSVFAGNRAGRSVMEVAVAAGGKKLDAFETILPEFYAAHGFVATSRIPWNEAEAPPGWNKAALSEFNGGEPDVVFMALDEAYQGWHSPTDGKKFTDPDTNYGAAVSEQNKAVKRIQRRKNADSKPAVFNQLGAGTSGIQRLRTGDLDIATTYGTATPGSTQVVGIHYSRSPRTTLAGDKYGNGLKGAESRRLDGADPQLKKRIHFYVDTGEGIAPEAGVGGDIHGVVLNNLYDVTADPLGLRAMAERAAGGRDPGGLWFNDVESAIIAAGFDGVYVPGAQGNQGVAVLLGDKNMDVPVEQLGSHAAPSQTVAPTQTPSRKSYALLGSEIRSFSENEQAIKAAAPSAELKSGTLYFNTADEAAVLQFFPQAGGAKILNQPNRGGFDPARLTTMLTEKADFSTFLHETGHFYLTVYADMASQPNATQEMRDDMQTILDWFGVKDLETWNSMSVDEQRKYHEQWAYSYELYLFEGKAPSVQMQTMFDRFSAWLRDTYQSIKDELNAIYKAENGQDLPALTGEVRGVMDRMLASQDQIKQAEQVRFMVPVYQTQEQSGMSDAEWTAYQQISSDATDAANSELTNATLRQMKWLTNARSRVLKEMQKATAEQRKKVKEEIQKEVEQEPLYVAMKFIKTGETTDENGNQIKVLEGNKLLLSAVKAMYPESKSGLTVVPDFRKLGYGQHGMLSEDGLHPDIIAGIFGFASGDHLVRELLNARKLSDEVEIRTDQRMLEDHGEMVDPKAIEIAVERAVHNEARSRFVAVELRHLAKSTSPVRVMIEAAKQAARMILSNRMLSDINPKFYTKAEGKAAKQAIDFMKKGESSKAGAAKQSQLLNNQLASESIKINQEVAKATELFKKIFGSDERLSKSRDMNYVSAARAILANYGLGNTELGVNGYIEQIKAYDQEFFAEIEPMITAQNQKAKPFDQLTVEEFRDMRDQVQALWHISKRSRQIEIDGKMLDRKEVVSQLTARIKELDTGKARAGYDKAMSDWDKRKIMLMGARAALRRVESWCDAMDGGKPDGVFRTYIWNPISEAISKYRIEKTKYLESYLEIIKSVEKGLDKGSISAPEIAYTFKNKAELLHAMLHTGNESNKRKLLLGREWVGQNEDGTIDTQQWDAFMQRMYAEGTITKEDWDFAQKVWDLMETMKPAAQKVHRDMYGFYFKEITADEVETPFGKYRGGYIPAVTDPWIVTDAAMRNEQETQASDNSYMFPTTGRGFTKGRVEYNKPLMLDLGFLPSHIDKVLRFTYIEPRIKDVARIVKTNKDFAAAMDALDSTIRGDMLVPWLQRSAQQMVQLPMKGRGGQLAHKFFSEVRTRTGMQMMVANITNALQQITGLSISLLKVQPSYLRNALWLYVRQPTAMADMISEKSEYMKTRMSNQQFEVNKQIEELLVNPSKYEKLRDFAHKHGYFMQSGMQNLVDTITWTGAYNQSMAKDGNEKAAVRAADSAVRLTQGSFAPEDVSRFESGNAFVRAFTMFYSYFNMQANLLGSEFAKTSREFGVKKGMGKLFYTYVFGFMIPAVLSQIIVEAAGGFDDGDDDEYDMYDAMSLFFGSQAKTALAMVPIAGSVAITGFNMWNDKRYDDHISTSASISALESTVRAPHSVYEAIANDKSWKTAVRDTLTAFGMIAGLPLGQLGKPLGFIADVEQGKAQPESAMDYVRGLISGKDVNRKD
jgi:hypothetical protein